MRMALQMEKTILAGRCRSLGELAHEFGAAPVQCLHELAPLRAYGLDVTPEGHFVLPDDFFAQVFDPDASDLPGDE